MGDPIRVLHVVVNMNRGGAETLLMNLYRNIDRSTVQFDFLTCKEGVFDDEIKNMGGNVYRIPYITEKGHFGYIKELEQFFSSHSQYKIVHSHMDKMSGFVLRAANKYKIPVRIAHSHNTSSEGSLPAKMYKWYAGKHIVQNATHLLACSEAAARWLYQGKTKDVKILQNGIECEKFMFSEEVRKETRTELNLGNEFIIGHVGRFNHQKNHVFLLDIFSDVCREVPNAKLVLVGDGPLRKEIEAKVKTLQLEDKVLFLGVRSDIDRLLQCFDVFVFPSLHEGLPVTLIEAQGAGLPCIVSDQITNEVDMGVKLVQYCSLDGKMRWVEQIKQLVTNSFPRIKSSQFLSEKGYNIKNTAVWTQGFYSAI
ncbi:glycosyltransferase family 1 protein [Alkalihalobacillus sp. MEB130]|uniref:glycosyltransferase family 1 protein n=1 Tax=Alkalihalobacillus sp. MEB130 TaxID=2976704 RepID=UPI0028DD5B01|nr:glycosyltransferase family 1 protein [Alkalihalobacillus sp. MEB130]MDT8861107.1 glycosyltransferase family 1 protein [Alkalihalobacillus sp. MEB130]